MVHIYTLIKLNVFLYKGDVDCILRGGSYHRFRIDGGGSQDGGMGVELEGGESPVDKGLGVGDS